MEQENKHNEQVGDQNQDLKPGRPADATAQNGSLSTTGPGLLEGDQDSIGNMDDNPDRIADIDDLHEIQASDDLQEPEPKVRFHPRTAVRKRMKMAIKLSVSEQQ